jgi:Ca2+-binding RTX toxin-like protein
MLQPIDNVPVVTGNEGGGAIASLLAPGSYPGTQHISGESMDTRGGLDIWLEGGSLNVNTPTTGANGGQLKGGTLYLKPGADVDGEGIDSYANEMTIDVLRNNGGQAKTGGVRAEVEFINLETGEQYTGKDNVFANGADGKIHIEAPEGYYIGEVALTAPGDSKAGLAGVEYNEVEVNNDAPPPPLDIGFTVTDGDGDVLQGGEFSLTPLGHEDWTGTVPAGDHGYALGAGGDDDYALTGGEHHDVLTGGLGNDILTGGAGDDLLIGGAGENTLTGGDGHDTFRFTTDSLDGKADTIADFKVGEDKLDLSDLLSGATDNPLALENGGTLHLDLQRDDSGNPVTDTDGNVTIVIGIDQGTDSDPQTLAVIHTDMESGAVPMQGQDSGGGVDQAALLHQLLQDQQTQTPTI